MKKSILAGVALLCASAAMAQGDDYNRLGVSYTNTHFGINDGGQSVIANELGMRESPITSIGTNGFSIDYRHGWSLSNSLPMYIEAGLSFGFNAGSSTIAEDVDDWSDYYIKSKMDASLQNMNFTIPVSFVWSFKNVFGTPLTISPYTGINFKINLMQRGKIGVKLVDTNLPANSEYLEDFALEGPGWMNLYSDNMILDALDKVGEGDDLDAEEYAEYQALGKQLTWNRFQMGWQIGVGFQFERYYLGLEYALDFLPAYSKTWITEEYVPSVGSIDIPVKARINTGTFKLSLAYCF